jgi:hypothetical protein
VPCDEAGDHFPEWYLILPDCIVQLFNHKYPFL